MAGMKVTLSAAMRARDVSRPREDHLAEAAAREEREGTAERGMTAAEEEASQPRVRRRRRRLR
jgi:hypothetical protein